MANNDVQYSVSDAVKKVKELSREKFDASIELHINLGSEVKKQNQSVRFSVTPPHGTGKSIKVATLSSGKVADSISFSTIGIPI